MYYMVQRFEAYAGSNFNTANRLNYTNYNLTSCWNLAPATTMTSYIDYSFDGALVRPKPFKAIGMTTSFPSGASNREYQNLCNAYKAEHFLARTDLTR